MPGQRDMKAMMVLATRQRPFLAWPVVRARGPYDQYACYGSCARGKDMFKKSIIPKEMERVNLSLSFSLNAERHR
jgi:hypothetical protein